MDQLNTNNAKKVETSVQEPEFAWYSLRLGVDPLFSPISYLFKDVEAKDSILMIIYFLLSIISLLVLQIYFYNSGDAGEDFNCVLFESYGAGLISYDLILFTLSFFIFLGFDRIKYGFSLWSYILFMFFSIFGAIAIVGPFYMGLRVSQQSKINKYGINFIKGGSNSNNKPQIPVGQHSENPENGKTEDNNGNNGDDNNNKGCGFCCQSMIPCIIFVVLMFWFMTGPTPFPTPDLCEDNE